MIKRLVQFLMLVVFLFLVPRVALHFEVGRFAFILKIAAAFLDTSPDAEPLPLASQKVEAKFLDVAPNPKWDVQHKVH